MNLRKEHRFSSTNLLLLGSLCPCTHPTCCHHCDRSAANQSSPPPYTPNPTMLITYAI